MKQFFKFLLASVLGMFITIFLITMITVGLIGSMFSSIEKERQEVITEHSVLYLEFDNPIPDRSSDNPLANFNFETFEPNVVMGLKEILDNIEKARHDDNIKGILLSTSFLETGFATLEEVRDALIDFKDSGKFIYSYAEIYTQPSYYLATVADEIHMNPAGYFDLKGLSAQLMFFKGTMEKLDIEPQVIRHGKYKSAIEPFVREEMSDENREQNEQLIGSIWGHLVRGIAERRNIPASTINALADGVEVSRAEAALEHRLIDKISYRDEMIAMLKEKTGTEQDEELQLVTLGRYRKVNSQVKKEGVSGNNRIAVVYANGEIREGESRDDIMGSETIAKALKDARENKNVKAIVLRVNSPGGSALASEVIWREMALAKEQKPTVVSMGNLAASGGYYIACSANKIVASENTITGSIGVFGLIPNMKGFFNNKLGITIDTVNTNKHSDINTVFRPLTETEKNIIQEWVESVYEDFITHVAEGRGMSVERVDSLGQGRVWSGTDALNIGLIDEIGGLEKAIDIAAELADLGDNYRLKSYPEQKMPFQMLMRGLSEDVEKTALKAHFGEQWKYYDYLQNFVRQKGIFARMPFDYVIE